MLINFEEIEGLPFIENVQHSNVAYWLYQELGSSKLCRITLTVQPEVIVSLTSSEHGLNVCGYSDTNRLSREFHDKITMGSVD